jgi:anthranilate phosphoribosyltransferase
MSLDATEPDAALGRAVRALAEGGHPDAGDLEGAFDDMLAGHGAPERVAAFLMGLRRVGESADVLLAGARAMRRCVSPVVLPGLELLDTCGTGGLPFVSLNTSTAAAIVVAACGGHVAKHGNRSVPPKTGSADVLEALGVRLEAPAAVVEACVREVGVGFLYARAHHGAMRHVAPVRQRLGFRTVFNLLGPLTNPAGAQHQLLGVFSPQWLERMASTLAALGTKAAWVVHGQDGVDEISVSAPTSVVAVREGQLEAFTITPEDAGLARSAEGALAGGSAAHNAQAIGDVLAGVPGAFRDAVVLNAAAGLMILSRASDLREGAGLAGEAIDSGRAQATLARWVALSNLEESPS